MGPLRFWVWTELRWFLVDAWDMPLCWNLHRLPLLTDTSPGDCMWVSVILEHQLPHLEQHPQIPWVPLYMQVKPRQVLWRLEHLPRMGRECRVLFAHVFAHHIFFCCHKKCMVVKMRHQVCFYSQSDCTEWGREADFEISVF